MLIGHTGDIARFANRDRYAAYNGTAPIEIGSGERTVHRVSKRGNRNLNHALHLAAITQLRQPTTAGRIYFDRKVDEGKTKREALRSLKRHISNAVYRPPPRRRPPRCWLSGPGRTTGTTPSQRGRSLIPATGSSARSLPDPNQRYDTRPAVGPNERAPTAFETAS